MPNIKADFAPIMVGYTTKKPFRFWCQTVLPMIYDDSLSYYELLCKVVNYLNNLIADTSALETNVSNLYDSYASLQNYINDYFDNVDFQQEINAKLDDMSTDGTLSDILTNIASTITSALESRTDALTLELSDIKTQMSTLTSRVNALMALPAGATTGDAELADARIGWDNTVYNSAGDAIRNQTKPSLKSIDRLLVTSDFNLLQNNIIIPCSFNALDSQNPVANAPVEGWVTGLVITCGKNATRNNGDIQIFISEGSGAALYRKYSNSTWSKWVTGYEELPQYRADINSMASTYHKHVYEYTKDGTFYADPSNNRWTDLPTDDVPYVITNARYGSYTMQTAVKANNTPDSIYHRFVATPYNPNTPPENPAWIRVSADFTDVNARLSSVMQFRDGVNGNYENYGSYVYNVKPDGTFYVDNLTHEDSETHEQVNNWLDLPNYDSGFVITNTKYGSYIMQSAVPATDTPDSIYHRFVPFSGTPQNPIWVRVSADFTTINTRLNAVTQCRDGVNAQFEDYHRHIYEIKLDGTFYCNNQKHHSTVDDDTTPLVYDWLDLPSYDSAYIITNARYGSFIKQSAVKATNPNIEYTRFISNDPLHEVLPYYWVSNNAFEISKYGKTTIPNSGLTVGLPFISLYGDTSTMSKENEVRMTYQYGDIRGNCDIKWQGGSSILYEKKNYTFKFVDGTDGNGIVYSGLNVDAQGVNWGTQKKFCFKANYIDNTSALNVCGAKLWSQIVADRGTHPAISHDAPNNGAMDGFPCIIMLNGEFHGLYTWNTPKDKWAFGMGQSDNEYLVNAEIHSAATQFSNQSAMPTTEDGDIVDFELEYKKSSVSAESVLDCLNTMLNEVAGLNSEGWELIANNRLDVNTAIDYMIFSALMSNTDGVDKNFILSTYDATKWWFNAYDLDSILGNHYTGGSYYLPNDNDNVSTTAPHNATSFTALANTSHLFNLIWTHSKSALVERYNELRSGILSEANLYKVFYNFCVRIPQPVIDEDNKKWGKKPGTATETLERILNWYRMRCEFIDEEIADQQEVIDAELQAFKNYLEV